MPAKGADDSLDQIGGETWRQVDKLEGSLQGKMTGPGNELTGVRGERVRERTVSKMNSRLQPGNQGDGVAIHWNRKRLWIN